MAEKEMGITEDGGLYRVEEWAEHEEGPVFGHGDVVPTDGFSLDVATLGPELAYLIQFHMGEEDATPRVAMSRKQVKDLRHMLGLALEWEPPQ